MNPRQETRFAVFSVWGVCLLLGAGSGLAGSLYQKAQTRNLEHTVQDEPAALAVLGREGVVEGIDYRGVPVLAAMRRVPGTSWHLVAKVDAEEAYAPVRQQSRLIGLATALLVAALGIASLLVWYRQRMRLYRQRYEAEAERRALLGHYDYLSRYANDIILLLDEEARIIEANDRAVETYGYTREELLGMHVRNLRAPAHRDAFRQQWEALERRKGLVYETEHQSKDGRTFPVEVSIRLIEVAGRRNRQAIVRDISERKRAAEALRKSEERYRRIVETAQEGIWLIDERGKISYVNKRLASMLGCSEEEILGRPVYDFISPELHEEARRNRERRRQGFRDQYDFTFRRKDGSVLHTIVSTNPLHDESGNYQGSLGMLTDLTIRWQLQEQLYQAQKMQAIGRLAGGVAHDFNNLLTVVIGYGEILRESLSGDDRGREFASAILQAATRGANLTRQLLGLSRHQVPAPSVVQVNTVAAELGSLLRQVIGEDVVLTEMLRPGLWNTRIDRSQLEQILLNLIVNGRDAMPKGGTILLETDTLQLHEESRGQHPGLNPGRYVMIAVTDTGSGMDESVVSHLFEPFFTTKEPGKGSGLGLSIVYGIVRQAGGAIEVQSVPGVGSTFRVYLPATEEAVTAERPAPAAAEPARTGATILVVEDDPPVRELIRIELAALNYAVLEARDAQDAVEIAEKHPGPIHLLLTDVVMPKMRGPELAREILTHRPLIRVVYMSGYIDLPATLPEFQASGARYLQKPFTEEELGRMLRESLDEPGPRASVLIADDDTEVRGTLRLILEEGGHTVGEVGSGVQAMQRLSEQRFDVLLTDLVMPDYNGLELIRMVRQRYPGLKVIATSGAVADMLGVAIHAGASAALEKPIHPDILLGALADLLG